MMYICDISLEYYSKKTTAATINPIIRYSNNFSENYVTPALCILIHDSFIPYLLVDIMDKHFDLSISIALR